MTYTEAQKRATYKYREKNVKLIREKTKDYVQKSREKWREYSLESKRLCAISI